MSVLFLTQVLPYPLNAGPKIRAYYVLRYLAQHHDVTLVSFVRSEDTHESIQHLETFCRQVHTLPLRRSRVLDASYFLESLLMKEPFIIRRDWDLEMVNLLVDLVNGPERYDYIHADQLWMAPCALWTKSQAKGDTKPRLVLDKHNAVYRIPERMAAGERNPVKRRLLMREARKLARFEVRICRKFDHVTWVSTEDFNSVQEKSDRPIPNSGVIPICGAPTDVPTIERSSVPRRVTFVGGLHYPPNAQGACWYAEEIFSRVLEHVPDEILTIIGKQPPSGLHHLGIPSANLEVTGFVEDLTPYLQETGAFIVPLLAGGGMRVKILDAWIWGVPTISTSIGAEGIQFQEDKNILIADTVQEMATATIKLLKQPRFAEELASNGRCWVEEKYGWRTVYQAWNQIYCP